MGKKQPKQSTKKKTLPGLHPKISKSPPLASKPQTKSLAKAVKSPRIKRKTILNNQNLARTPKDPAPEKKTKLQFLHKTGEKRSTRATPEIEREAEPNTEAKSIIALSPKDGKFPLNLKPKMDFYNVEEILDKKLCGRYYKYLIKWEGYPDEANSWEPKSNLPPHLVEEFEVKSRNLRGNNDTVPVENEAEGENTEGDKNTNASNKGVESAVASNQMVIEEDPATKPDANTQSHEESNKTGNSSIDEKGSGIELFIAETVPDLTNKPPVNFTPTDGESNVASSNNNNNRKVNSAKKSLKKSLIPKKTVAATLVESDAEGPGSNRATKFGDFRLGDRLKAIRKLRYNKKSKMVYAIIEWKDRDDGFVPLTSKVSLDGLKANVPNETINYLVNLLIDMKEKKKDEEATVQTQQGATN